MRGEEPAVLGRARRPSLRYLASASASILIPASTESSPSILGKDANALREVLLSSKSENEKVQAANAFFRARLPQPDNTIALVGKRVE